MVGYPPACFVDSSRFIPASLLEIKEPQGQAQNPLALRAWQPECPRQGYGYHITLMNQPIYDDRG
jgi:hypothetical protein